MKGFSRREAVKLLGLAGLAMAGCKTSEDDESDPASQEGAFSSKCEAERLKQAAGTCPRELHRYEKIVVLMMENRSFDHYFGHLSMTGERGKWDGKTPDPQGKLVDGLVGNEVQRLVRPGSDGIEEFKLFHATNFKLRDIAHEWDDCHLQFNGGRMDGFIQAHFVDMLKGDAAVCGRKCAELGDPMAYYKREDTPVLHALADNYALCDRWFSSVMGPTWPNRHYLHAGTSSGIKTNSKMDVDSNPNDPGEVRNIWHELRAKCVSAANYTMDIPWATGGFGVFNSVPTRPVFTQPKSSEDNGPPQQESFEDACTNGTLPTVSIIDPAFIFSACDDHPPHDVKAGQAFISSIYSLLTRNQEQWSKTLFIITYDEHGSFYDHVTPPKVGTEESHAEFRQLGMRVPALVIGPYVKRKYVSHAQYDHVSFLSTVTNRFGLTPLNARVAATRDLRDCIDMNAVETAGAPPPPIAVRSVRLSESVVFESIAESPGQAELARVTLGGPVSLEQKRRATDRMLAAFDRLGVANVGR